MANSPNGKTSYFVVAAEVAAELHKATMVAKDISLTASNARALALRAGHGAAGFRALTDFIDELANKTVNASGEINQRAMSVSRLASETARLKDAVARMNKAQVRAHEAPFQQTLAPVIRKTDSAYRDVQNDYDRQIFKLIADLNELARELRTATVLAAMSRVEASASGKDFEDSLNVIANNVAQAAEKIQAHVKTSQRLFTNVQHATIH
ncbi:hypothetical protein [Teredinibacter turnerae]|uniref:hypothetical protein n=1 Tax=Teredinibacter turnerae TaxID=2426 RepID=UPI000375AA97|nr:hypothetical protein [Teredinibacter turnerae]